MELLEQFLNNELGTAQTADKLQLFTQYEEILLGWNEKINLVSRKTGSIENHILNSIFFLKNYPLTGNEKMIDIGTGGGFPGIPLKILFPELKLTLLDSIQKKTMVLTDIASQMGMEVEVLTGRAEKLSKNANYKAKFDVVISKAVSTLNNLYTWGHDFLNVSGRMICLKGGVIDTELSELSLKNRVKTETIEYSFPSEYNIEDKKIVIINQ
jgi:16S rRNA (guanine527-N7)-methyltransferase